jgi:hypothetical protein
MQLSVLVVSHNRRQTLASQVLRLDRLLNHWLVGVSFSVIVSETSDISPGKSAEIETICKRWNWLYRFKDQGFSTAEEHLLDAIQLCRGEYVWTLGDDDPILATGLNRMRSEILADAKDVIVFNSYGAASDFSKISLRSRSWINEDKAYSSFSHLLLNYGFWYVPSGFSTLVFRRKLFSKDILASLNRTTPIYSHVTMLCLTGQEKTVLLAKEPLVIYKTNKSDESSSDDNWDKYSATSCVSLSYPWVASFTRHLLEMNDNGCISFNEVPWIVDQNHVGIFTWHLLPVSIMLDQILRDCKALYDSRIPCALHHDLTTLENCGYQQFAAVWGEILAYDQYISESFIALMKAYQQLFENYSGNASGLRQRRTLTRSIRNIEEHCEHLAGHCRAYLHRPLEFSYVYTGSEPSSDLYQSYKVCALVARDNTPDQGAPNYSVNNESLSMEFRSVAMEAAKRIEESLGIFVWIAALSKKVFPKWLRKSIWRLTS